MHTKLTLPCLFLTSSLGLGVLVAAASSSQDAGRPGLSEQHEWLLSFEGTWDVEVSMGAENSQGTWTMRPGPGKRWMLSEFEGSFLGQPYEGHEVLGYDPASKRFISVWTDSLATRPMVMHGTRDSERNTMTMIRETTTLEGAPPTTTTRNVIEYHDENRMTSTSYDGEEVALVMEFTRRR